MTAYDKEAADNGNRVTTKVIEGKATPHTASTGKGSEKPGKKQKKQIVFDKAKEIADKEKKKRKAEDDKPKQKPLTEAERKDAEEVAGALGYRVEWVDAMEENGTIDADKKCREPVSAGAGARGGARSEADGRWQVQGFAEGG